MNEIFKRSDITISNIGITPGESPCSKDRVVQAVNGVLDEIVKGTLEIVELED